MTTKTTKTTEHGELTTTYSAGCWDADCDGHYYDPDMWTWELEGSGLQLEVLASQDGPESWRVIANLLLPRRDWEGVAHSGAYGRDRGQLIPLALVRLMVDLAEGGHAGLVPEAERLVAAALA